MIYIFLVRLTHFLPSGKYQVAMVPYKKNDKNEMVAMAKPSCTCRLKRLDLGQHALAIILGILICIKIGQTHCFVSVLLGIVIFSGIFSTMYSTIKEDDYFVK